MSSAKNAMEFIDKARSVWGRDFKEVAGCSIISYDKDSKREAKIANVDIEDFKEQAVDTKVGLGK